ncbi:MAG: divalent metal cation transporter [Novosphingobium sp.]|nr:divalent metal cation transporter [Novosphingobium sp.]
MSKPAGQPQRRRRSLLSVLGPGLVTGAADDDPGGIGTYSQGGAQFGYAIGWMLLFSFPLVVSIQEICAQIGATTGRGIAQNLRRHYPRPLLRGVVVLLFIANVFNLGADLGAMSAALHLLVPGPVLLFTLGFGILSIALEVLVSYARYVRILKWSTLSLFAYFGVLFFAHVPFGEAMRGIFVPHVTLDRDYMMALVAIFGTTISPYLFFWQAGQEVEEQHRRHTKPLCLAPRKAGPELHRIRVDTVTGLGFSNLTALSIIIATAATLHVHGVTRIESAAQAAGALRPFAGDWAFALFALGIIGTGLLAVPVLAGSIAYALSECFGWVEGLNRKPLEAKAFYGAIALAVCAGMAMNLLRFNPMRALYWSAVLNGLLAPPLMFVTMLIARNPHAMGHLTISRRLAIGGWLSTAVMTIVGILFLVS